MMTKTPHEIGLQIRYDALYGELKRREAQVLEINIDLSRCYDIIEQKSKENEELRAALGENDEGSFACHQN